jgi:hypothetical protein
MSISEQHPKPHKILIITSSGGGGLLQAANAKEQEFKAKDPKITVLKRDVMKDWMWKWAGRFCIYQWNRAQLQGDVWTQSFFGTVIPIAGYLFWPHIFFCTLYTLFKENVDQVLDTQIMGTSAVIKAIRIYNWKKQRAVYLEKVLVDLPSKKATHFFGSIKSLSKKDRRHFKLITVAPLLEEGETDEQFWTENCNLTPAELVFENYYVRQSFRKFQNVQKKTELFKIKTCFYNQEELELIQKSLKRGSLSYEVQGNEISFTINPNDRLFTILLGSQPAQESTLNYVKKFIQLAKEEPEARIHLFVFCANHNPKQETLFKRVVEKVTHARDYPSNLSIVPMSFQTDEVIAPLFFHSHMTCTRSGGQTAMELMCVGQKEIWVHSETKKKKSQPTNEELLAGIPGWESANAAYLQKMKGAKIVTPDHFVPYARILLR